MNPDLIILFTGEIAIILLLYRFLLRDWVIAKWEEKIEEEGWLIVKLEPVIDEIEDINEITGKLLSALETGGIETPDMNGLTFEQHEILQRALEDVRYTVAELLSRLTEV